MHTQQTTTRTGNAFRRTAVAALLAMSAFAAISGNAVAQVPGANGKIYFRAYGATTEDGGSFSLSDKGVSLGQTSKATANFDEFAVSPNGRQIAAVGHPNNNYEIYLMNVDGTEIKRITQTTGNGADHDPSFSPDGKRLVFTRSSSVPIGKVSQEDVYTVDISSKKLKRLTNDKAGESNPAFSPSGKQIAFAKSPTHGPGGTDIYAMSPNGRRVHRLTRYSGYDAYPSYSPNGKTIVFASDRASGMGQAIFTMSASGTNQRLLVKNRNSDEDAINPSFSPDGKKVVFSLANQFDENWKTVLRVFTLRTGKQVTVGPATTTNLNPSWSVATSN